MYATKVSESWYYKTAYLEEIRTVRQPEDMVSSVKLIIYQRFVDKRAAPTERERGLFSVERDYIKAMNCYVFKLSLCVLSIWLREA